MNVHIFVRVHLNSTKSQILMCLQEIAKREILLQTQIQVHYTSCMQQLICIVINYVVQVFRLVVQLCSGITHGKVHIAELYVHRFHNIIFQLLFIDLVVYLQNCSIMSLIIVQQGTQIILCINIVMI